MSVGRNMEFFGGQKYQPSPKRFESSDIKVIQPSKLHNYLHRNQAESGRLNLAQDERFQNGLMPITSCSYRRYRLARRQFFPPECATTRFTVQKLVRESVEG